MISRPNHKHMKHIDFFKKCQNHSVDPSAKSYMTNDLLIYGENICAFPHILGSPSSYMNLHPIPSEFPYI